mgnify:CR=1 FL=1
MNTTSAPIDLTQVRKLFAVPQVIADSDFLRKEIAERMREKLALVNIDAQRVCDLGCGLGEEFPHLKQRFPTAQLIGIDASLAMLQAGDAQRAKAHRGMSKLLQRLLPQPWSGAPSDAIICGNFANLSLTSNCVDVIWSNLALHWHPSPDLVLAEWRRVLRVGGICMFSSFGPDTMIELRQAFAEVDQDHHLLPFVDMHDFGDMAVHAGLATPVMDMEKITIRYSKVEQLLLDTVLEDFSESCEDFDDLPKGLIHGDLFRDNTLFDGDTLSAILDFSEAGRDYWLLDIAITINDFCSDWPQVRLNQALYQAFVDGYQQVRPLTEDEQFVLPSFLAMAATRFWLSRLSVAKRNQEEGRVNEHVLQKDPQEMLNMVKARLA